MKIFLKILIVLLLIFTPGVGNAYTLFVNGVAAGGGGIGDMSQSTYDTNADSMVDNDKINGSIDATKIGGGGVTTTEFDYLGTVTSNVQTQITAQIPKSTIVAAGDVIVGSGAGAATVITKGAANTIFGVNAAGVLGYYNTFQFGDTTAQFKSDTALKGTRINVQSSISDTMLLSDTPIITGNVTWTNISQGAGTYTRVFEEALNVFTVLQQFDATAGIKIGATGVLITSDDDGAITFLGTSAGEDEDLTINLDDTANTAVVSSSTGVATIQLQGATANDAMGLASTGVIKGAIGVLDMGTGATYSLTAANAYGALLLQTDSDSATTVALPDYQATADVDHVKIGACVCVLELTAFATIVDPAADDKIRTNNGTLNGAGVSVTGPATVGAYSCYVLTDVSSDVGHWTQMGINGAWPVTP